MKLDFNWKNDGNVHAYCIHCHAETVDRQRINGNTQYYCSTCNKYYDRWVKIDPEVKWWLSEDKEYWHESTGVFVRSPDYKFLFFKRNVFPFALTVPSGHVDTGEEPKHSATRELEEEVGIEANANALHHIATDDIIGDACSRGADAHRWHAYILELSNFTQPIEVKEEGHTPIWLTLDEASKKTLTSPVKYIIDHYANLLSN